MDLRFIKLNESGQATLSGQNSRPIVGGLALLVQKILVILLSSPNAETGKWGAGLLDMIRTMRVEEDSVRSALAGKIKASESYIKALHNGSGQDVKLNSIELSDIAVYKDEVVITISIQTNQGQVSLSI